MAGAPPFFETPEALEDSIEEYFKTKGPKVLTKIVDGVEVPFTDGKGNPVMIENPATTAGLALHLGYASRQSLYDQKDRGEAFSYIIKRAILAIEAYHEARLSQGGNPAGSIFWLKNHDWSDRQDMALIGDPKLVFNVPSPTIVEDGLKAGTVEIVE